MALLVMIWSKLGVVLSFLFRGSHCFETVAAVSEVFEDAAAIGKSGPARQVVHFFGGAPKGWWLLR